MPLCGCASATLSIFTTSAGWVVGAEPASWPVRGQVGGGAGAVALVATAAVLVAADEAEDVDALPRTDDDDVPHAVSTRRTGVVTAIQRVRRRDVGATSTTVPLTATGWGDP